MKSRQFCSVCKQWLDMEVVPTGDGDDDGVVWFRCPQCQGFLPKLSSAVADADAGGVLACSTSVAVSPEPGAEPDVTDEDFEALPGDEFALAAGLPGLDDGADEVDGADGADGADEADEETDGDDADDEAPDDGSPSSVGGGPAAHAEPVLEYAAMLAAVDPAAAVPYRPWATYEVGQCILHLAWNDCGVVVDREALPGGRRVIKCWFQGAGVVRLIENAPR